MKLSLNWLKEYLPGIEISSLDSLIAGMIGIGFDIESVNSEAEQFKGFVIGKVTEKEKHPNADKLSLCKVDVGGRLLNIVCGAPNVAKDQMVCVAEVGSMIPNGSFEIKKTKIRGEVSEGMICSESELGLSEDHSGILVLGDDAVAGKSFAEYKGLDDVTIEIGVTPNRGDLLSHIGVAREIASIYGINLSMPEAEERGSGESTASLISITIDNDKLCRRFTGRVIKNVSNGDSPEWMKKRLTAAGMRPRSLIVDITNYVMLETGQPLHAFDYDKIAEQKIIVKTANDGDMFTTLDSKERKLSGHSLMVCDANGYSAIAGIMGGEHSEISESTRNVFLESAFFDPVSIRKNSKRLGLMTDASHRFERGVDINMVRFASLRASTLMSKLAGGIVSDELLDIYPAPFPPLEATMRIHKANKLLGTNISEDESVKLLNSIGIKKSETKGEATVFSIPEWRRHDIERECDLTEELARLYGYSNIESSFDFRTSLIKGRDSHSEKLSSLKRTISDHLTGRGFNEVLNIPLTKLSGDETGKSVRLINSLTSELNGLRSDLIQGILKVIAHNIKNIGSDITLKLFECGRIFQDTGNSFTETECLIMGISGISDGVKFYEDKRNSDLTDIKGEVEMLLSKLNIETFGLFCYNDNQFEGFRIDVSLRGEIAGNIFKADSNLLERFGLESDVYLGVFELEKLARHLPEERLYKPIGRYPVVKRDIAIVVNKGDKFEELRNLLSEAGGALLKSVELLDIYEGEQLPEGKKSIAFSLEFASEEKTLTDQEVNEAMRVIISEVSKRPGAALRE